MNTLLLVGSNGTKQLHLLTSLHLLTQPTKGNLQYSLNLNKLPITWLPTLTITSKSLSRFKVYRTGTKLLNGTTFTLPTHTQDMKHLHSSSSRTNVKSSPTQMSTNTLQINIP